MNNKINKVMEYNFSKSKPNPYARKLRSLKDEVEGWMNLYFNYRASVTNKTIEEAQDDFFNEFMAKTPVIDSIGNKIRDELLEQELGRWGRIQFRDSIGAPREGAD